MEHSSNKSYLWSNKEVLVAGIATGVEGSIYVSYEVALRSLPNHTKKCNNAADLINYIDDYKKASREELSSLFQTCRGFELGTLCTL